MLKNIISGQSFEGKMSTREFNLRFRKAENLFGKFLEAIGYDYKNDPNMKETPHRYTKVMMKEICKNTYEKSPKITVFDNQTNYDGIVFEGNIDVKSICSHHLAFIKGKAYIAYIPKDKVIGLSKLNRVVDYFARRPQLQEQLTMQIHNYLKEILQCDDVAVLIRADHSCVSMRGVENMDSYTTTCKLSGRFWTNEIGTRNEFYKMIDAHE